MNTYRPKLAAARALILGLVTSLTLTHTAIAAPPDNLVVPIAGTLTGGAESVSLSGHAQIQSTLVTDPDFGGPARVILTVNLVGVSGAGQSPRSRYLATGEETVIRLLQPTDLVEIEFPVFPVGARGSDAARAVLASFVLTFDQANGRLLNATANFSTPLVSAF